MEPLFPSLDPSENIFEAAREGALASLRLHIERKNEDVNKPDDEGRTPLHWAAVQGHTHAVEYLFSKGANHDTTDDDGQFLIEIFYFIVTRENSLHTIHQKQDGHLFLVAVVQEKPILFWLY